MTFSFTIPGRVRGKGRPRFASRGKFVKVYTDSDTLTAEAMVRSLGLQAMEGARPLSGPVWLDIRVSMIPPVSWSQRKRKLANFVTGKPDTDNIVKLLGDALNGICWIDDSQIAALFFLRTYDERSPETVSVSFGELIAAEIPITKPEAVKHLPLFAEALA